MSCNQTDVLCSTNILSGPPCHCLRVILKLSIYFEWDVCCNPSGPIFLSITT